MTNNKRLFAFLILGVFLAVALLAVVFFRGPGDSKPLSVPATVQPVSITITPTSVWDALLAASPFAYFTPLPEPVARAIDGTYVKVDQSWPQWWKCMRCADYRTTGGIWRLQFDKGVMRIFYEVNNWHSLASYSIAGDHLYVFNDPYCPEHTGEYKWNLQNGELRLETVKDVCAFDLRAENLTKQSWRSCPLEAQSNEPVATAGSVPGCAENEIPVPVAVTPKPPLHVSVYGGDSRFFERPPDVIAHANSADTKPPDGISVSFAEESIPYGLQRVVWWNGNWIEATSHDSYASMGVQFLGEGMIGWARLLLDGQEVWRGNTSAIWSKSGRHGGYVEVSGFTPGAHTLRVESLGFDYRPVTVASFGFSQDGGVKNEEPQK